MPSVTLALSGGGAAGLGHIPVLEALDEAGIRPKAMAGTSIGALIGAAYAAGMSGADIRAHVMSLSEDPLSTVRSYVSGTGVSLSNLFTPLDAEEALTAVLPSDFPDRFEDLAIPLSVIVTDFHGRCEMRFSQGPLKPALAGSMAIPGVFKPVEIDGRICIDGGVTNILPLNALPEGDISLAVDVASLPPDDSQEIPGPMMASTGSMRIMMHALLEEHLRQNPPDILIKPNSRFFAALDFKKAETILQTAEPARAQTRKALSKFINA